MGKSNRWQKKTTFIFLVVLSFGFLVYFYFFKSSPSLEEKFVIEQKMMSQNPPTPFLDQKSWLNLKQAGDQILLPKTKIVYQTFNNCGPANLSMILSYYGLDKTQKELAAELRPYQQPQGNNDDKTVFPQEFVAAVEKYGLKALYRPNGSLQLIKLFLSNQIPVVVKTLLKKTQDSAHFRIVRGFDEVKKVIIVDDSYFGSNRKIDYFDFLTIWQPFNYLYIPVFPKEKEAIVKAVLGEEVDEKIAYWRAINRAQEERQKDPQNVWPVFNLANGNYHVGQYTDSVAYFEQIEDQLPRRALWYQIEPILAYQKLGNDQRVFEIINQILEDGNRAFSELYHVKGEIYLKQGHLQAARREFELALKYNHNFQPAKKALSQL